MSDVDQESAEMGMLIGADATRNSIANHIEERADAIAASPRMLNGDLASWLRELADEVRAGVL